MDIDRGKIIQMTHAGKDYEFRIRTAPWIGLDAMAVETRKKDYIIAGGGNPDIADADEKELARRFARAELFIIGGLQEETPKEVMSLPLPVINWIIKSYWDQFKHTEDPKNS